MANAKQELLACERECRARIEKTTKAVTEAVERAERFDPRLGENASKQFAALKASVHALFEPARIEARKEAAARSARLRHRANDCAERARQLREAIAQVRAGSYDEVPARAGEPKR